MLALNKYLKYTKVNAGLWAVYQFYIIFIFFFVRLETPGPVKNFVSLFKTGQAYRKYFETKHNSEQSLQRFI